MKLEEMIREVNMDNVNIYMHTTINTVKASDGAYGIVLEMPREGKEVYTSTHFGELDNCTKKCAELKTLLYALRKFKRPCNITIYTDSSYIQSGISWVPGWIASGWVTSKGNEVAYKEECQEVMELLSNHKYHFEIKTPHTYKNWLEMETERNREKARKA